MSYRSLHPIGSKGSAARSLGTRRTMWTSRVVAALECRAFPVRSPRFSGASLARPVRLRCAVAPIPEVIEPRQAERGDQERASVPGVWLFSVLTTSLVQRSSTRASRQ
jgi:hypothetical protein